jgi:hypothetical protein
MIPGLTPMKLPFIIVVVLIHLIFMLVVSAEMELLKKRKNVMMAIILMGTGVMKPAI